MARSSTTRSRLPAWGPRFVLLAISLSIILLTSFAAPAQSRKRKSRAAKPPIVVQEIDAASLTSLLERGSGNPRPLVVNFWATWCDPCREEFPDLVKLYQQFRPKGLDMIAVSLDDLADIKTEVPKFLRQMRATMPAYLLNVPDPDQIISTVDPQWSGALPATFLYDAEGKVVFKHFGRIKPLELRTVIERLVGSKVVMSSK
ncbi:MAG TPA: redoxin domain-containing protein [Pyrinomonadaceae bacterium]|nr:redoxin domain-containing protein [Pyrinomonadaceae bacterium]